MLPQDPITLALAIVSTLVLIRLLLPNILIIVGLVPLRNGFAGGPEDANSYWPGKIDDDLYREMLALGFRPEGTFWEQMPFSRRYEEFVFTRPGEKCFGILYPDNQIMPRRSSFLTVFETGGVVYTKNYCGGAEAQEGDFLATGPRTEPVRDLQPQAPAASPWNRIMFCLAVGILAMTLFDGSNYWLTTDQKTVLRVLGGVAILRALLPSRPRGTAPRHPAGERADLDLRLPLAETLARHQRNVNLLIAAGQQLPACFDAHEFIATQQRYHRHPRLRNLFQASTLTLLLSKLIILAPLPAIFFGTLGIQSPISWGVLLVEGLVGLYLRYGFSSAGVVNILRRFSGPLEKLEARIKVDKLEARIKPEADRERKGSIL
jgi:hypothetical protein